MVFCPIDDRIRVATIFVLAFLAGGERLHAGVPILTLQPELRHEARGSTGHMQEKPPLVVVLPLSVPFNVTGSLDSAPLNNGISGLLAGLRVLRKLNANDNIRLYQIQESSSANYSSDDQEAIANATCIISRPTTGGNNLGDYIAGLQRDPAVPLVLGSLSVGLKPSLKAQARPDNSHAHAATVTTNSEAVVDLTLWFAMEAFRPLTTNARGMAYTAHRDETEFPHFLVFGLEQSRRLASKSWSFLGMGNQVNVLFQRLVICGVNRFSGFHYKYENMNETQILEHLVVFVRKSTGWGNWSLEYVEHNDDDTTLECKFRSSNGKAIWITACKTLSAAVNNRDIVSIHLKEAQNTLGVVNEELISAMGSDQGPLPLLINVARHAIWNEHDVAEAVSKKVIRAASDLLDARCENNPTVLAERHPLLRLCPEMSGGLTHRSVDHLVRDEDEEDKEAGTEKEEGAAVQVLLNEVLPDVLVTRHIGGNTWDDLNPIFCEVVGRCLRDIERTLKRPPGSILTDEARKELTKVIGTNLTFEE